MLLERLCLTGRLAFCAGLVLAAQGVFAAPPSDAEIDAKLAALKTWQTETPRAERTFQNYQAKVKEVLTGVDVKELTFAQIEKLSDIVAASPEHLPEAIARLDQLASEETADGAVSAILHTSLSMRSEADNDATKASLRRALTHPGLRDAVQTDRGSQIYSLVGYVDEEVAADLHTEIVSLSETLSDDLPPSALFGAMEYVTSLSRLGEKVDSATRTSIRERLSGIFESSIARLSASEADNDKRVAESLKDGMKFLNGAFARGELIDHAAPTLTFDWVSGEKPLAGLDELKGKVVVLDFWATWCGPCIASFPKIAELQKHYEGYDVAIIGVTSLQGRHYPGDGADPIDTKDDPSKEHELMKEFMQKKNVTWPVVFTQEEVFNPDFGVRGIPHVAIIDPQGVVRYNGLHPAMPMREKTDKIDELLKKAGLPAPAAPAEDKPDAADKDE